MSMFDFLRPDGENRRGYSELDRPTTRRGLAKLVFRDHFFDLIPMNLILLVISLPALFWFVSGGEYILHAMGTDGTLADFISLSRTWVLVLLPCIGFAGPFLEAAYLVLRNLARDDFRHAKHTFITGLKSNWKQALLLSAASGAIPVLLWAGLSLYGPHIAEGRLLTAIPLLLSAVICLLWYMALPVLYIMLGTYRLPLVEQVKNALALTLRHLPLTAGIELLGDAPVILLLLTLPIGGSVMTGMMFILCAYYLLFGFAAARLLHAFLANYLCETYLNPRIDGAGTHIGMRREEDEHI